MRPIFIVSICVLLISQTTNAQTTVNTGSGGNFINNNFNLEWSIGEATVIETYQFKHSPFNSTVAYYTLSNGVLQPFALAIDTNYNKHWALTDLRIYPVPTNSIVNINITSSLQGKVRIDLMDATTRLLATQEFDYYGIYNKRQVDLTQYAASTYILSISLVADNKVILKQGSYKIQKIN